LTFRLRLRLRLRLRWGRWGIKLIDGGIYFMLIFEKPLYFS
jgi:hypothetical protein